MIRSLAQRPLRPLALVTVVGGASGYLWYATNQSRTNSSSTFDIQIKTRGPDGRPIPTARTLPLLSMSDVEHKVRQNASSTTIGRPNGLVWHYDTAFLAANDPIEDANAQALVERKASGAFPSGDLLFFAVMDGHGGFDTSRLLAKALIPSVALELTSLESAPFSDASSKPVHSPQSSTLSYLKSLLTRSHSTASKPYQFDADPKYVSAGIKAAFAKLDSEIVNSPIRLLESIEASPSNSPAHEHPMALPTMLPALSGSCALLAMLDTARRDLYVACTGDSGAVAGYWDEDANGQGRWRVEVLTEDQTGRNPNELKRMQSEHPSEEASYVIQRGRVLGGLEPSRAFGDSIYKWPKDLHAKLTQNLLPQGMKFRSSPRDLKTPPYVTPEPEVTHRKLSFLPLPSSQEQQPTTKSTLRFIVLATDGLWDCLSSSEVVSLVGGHLSGLKGIVPKSVLASTTIMTESSAGVEGKEKKSSRDQLEGNWAFLDENVGSHVIRNAFGGGDELALRKKVSIPPPVARSFRDDITVTVVWWHDGRQDSTQMKAKL